MTKALFTMIKAIRPAALTKSIHLEGDGLIAAPAANMVEGIARRLAVGNVEDFARFIGTQIGHDWAICTGISKHAKARIYTKRELARIGAMGVGKGELPAIARSRQHLAFVAGPGLVALDYDPAKEGGAVLTARKLHAVLCECCPWLEGVAMAIFDSSSSHIYRRSTGEELKGAGGLHVYLIVDDGRQAPRVTDAIFEATFNQYGFALITKSGAIYPRSLVDRSVPQPERLLFEAGVILSDDLEQRRGESCLIPGARLAVATVPTCPDYKSWRETDPLWLQRKHDAEPEATRVREAWITERLASGKISVATLKRALFEQTLADDFQVTMPGGKLISVAAIQANMHDFDGVQIPDPLEPDYRDGSLCAVIFPWGIHSMAHGGYSLHFADEVLELDNEPFVYELDEDEND